MNDIYLIAAIIVGIIAILIGAFTFISWRAISKYEDDVLTWLGDQDAHCYVEQVMYDFHDAGRRAFDAATEMKAMHYED